MNFAARLILLVLVLGLVAVLTDAGCRDITLSSTGYGYRRQTVSGAAKVNSMTVKTRHSSSACTSGVSYGFYGADIWVNRGCRAKFTVCFVSGNNRRLTCSSNNYNLAECNAPGMIQSVAVRRHISNSPCVQGFSFKFTGRKLVVLNGCRANFVVGYTD